MCSKYNAEYGKRPHRNSHVTENGLYYTASERNYSLIPQSLNSNLDDKNGTKMRTRFQQEVEMFSKPTYLYENDKLDDSLDFLSKAPLLPYDVHKKAYQHHDNYYRKGNEYQRRGDDQQNSHADQSYQTHNHVECNYYSSSKKHCDDACSNVESPPSSVHLSSVNKNNCCNNKSHNNCYKTSSKSFNGDYHHNHQYLQLKSLDRTTRNLISEPHYQHYCSHLYSKNNNSCQLSSSPRRRRKLPTTFKMPFSQKNEHTTELSSKCDLLSAESNNLSANDINANENDLENNFRSSYNYVLKEKLANNNDAASVLENDGFVNFQVYEYKNCQSFDEEDSKAALLYLQKHKNKRKLRISSAESGHYDEQVAVIELDNVEENVNLFDIYEQTKREQKLENLKKQEEISPKNMKLPAPPTNGNVSPSRKKSSSPPKNRRVLIYNIQSPRLSRLSTSNIRLQRSKLKIQNEIKGHNKSQSIDRTSCKDKYDIDHGRVLDSATHIEDIKIIAYHSRKHKNGNKNEDNGNNGNYSSDDDDDEDDFDNVSDFDSTDSDISTDPEEDYRSYAYKLTHTVNAIGTSLSSESSINSEAENIENPDALLVPSLFPNVPPYLAFSSNTKKGPDVPNDLYRVLKWRVTNVMPRVVRSILANSGMRLLKKTNEWMGVWGKHMKSPCFRTIRPYQKINHLPGSFKIGRKDSCWKNLLKLMAKYGKKDFGFMPKTYIIPNDLKQLRKSWPKYAQKNVKWIIKPPASARGTGIRVVDRWAQIPKRKPLIVQRYIERPLLINGSKFDLRLYVLVTSINPLRVYMYHNGLARFASVKYSDKSDTLSDRCMHLTNYSINKFSSNYSKNEDVNACHGHKWTIKSLWTYLNSRGVRTDLLWAALQSLVLRTILAGENSINNMIRANVESKYSCFELFGFDVLLDADLVPWLLEVNISPSLHSELPLDLHVKAPLVQSVLNTALYNIPPKIPIERQREIAVQMSLPAGPICYDKRLYVNYLSRSEKIKHNTFTRKSMEERYEYVNAILEHLTPDDVRCLIIAEDELARCSPLERIFPTVDTYKYLKYTEAPRYYNRLLDAWESRYGNNRIEGIHLLRQLCEDRYHLEVPQIPNKKNINYRTQALLKHRRKISSFNTKRRELNPKAQISQKLGQNSEKFDIENDVLANEETTDNISNKA